MEALIEALTQLAGVLFLVGLVATFVNGLVEWLFKPLLDGAGWGRWTPWAAMLLALAVSGLLGLDLFTPLVKAVGIEPLTKWVGIFLTAIAVGRGSNWLHDAWPGRP